MLKYDTLAHVAALKLYHNRSKEFEDRGQLYNYTYTTHSFTTACVTHVDQVIKQLVVLMGIINVESGGLIGDTLRVKGNFLRNRIELGVVKYTKIDQRDQFFVTSYQFY